MTSAIPQIQLSWEDPITGDSRNPSLTVPVAMGREFSQMPSELNGERVSRLVLNSAEISRFHLLIVWENNQFWVMDQKSQNGIFINGQREQKAVLKNGDILQIAPYEIRITWGNNITALPTTSNSQILFNPQTNLPDPTQFSAPPVVSPTNSFPPACFNELQVETQALHSTGLKVNNIPFLTVGAGLGSYILVDLLRICGVKSEQIKALGVDPIPYSRYQQLCLNSQIPLHERLRSNSDSCPDNIWAFPSYAWREAWHDLTKGNMAQSLRYLWQVFAEPTLIETYTPRAGNVFASIDREAKRINWEQIYEFGRVLAIRKTTDGQYAIAYSKGQGEKAFYITPYLHLATGYPGIKFLPDLQQYREATKDFQTVVNAYENHEHIYQNLAKNGGTVLIRGRGIVASRIIQKIYETRQQNQKIRLIHLLRSPKPKGNKFGYAQRRIKNHFEFQPFNWPKACWSGDLRVQLAKATPQEREMLMSVWGGTTTADRRDWQEMIEQGLTYGWYRIEFGDVEKVQKEDQKLITFIQDPHFEGTMRLEADYIIDATGLDGDLTGNPLLKDLITHYNLPLNYAHRLTVTNDFELLEMRTLRGKMYASGTITLGGPYAAVDSFLGLQYTALTIVEHLAKNKAFTVKNLTPMRSLTQWLKWVFNQSP
jgi:pSer/pThr/pTyr-binding forkhead associated (FHA) protein